jgi:hypothetical protein
MAGFAAILAVSIWFYAFRSSVQSLLTDCNQPITVRNVA